MRTPSIIVLIFGIISGLASLGDTVTTDIVVLQPAPADSLVHERSSILLLSVAKTSGDSLVVSTPWEIETPIEVSTKKNKEDFAKTLYHYFPQRSVLAYLKYQIRYHEGFSAPESSAFKFDEKMNVRTFWQHPVMSRLFKTVQEDVLAEQIVIDLRGWQDSTYAAVYDDPAAETRFLYKIGVHFLLGWNELHFASPAPEAKPVKFEVHYVGDRAPIEERQGRFHNSEMEAGCTSCHEGLPSASHGDSMTADCATCHRAQINNPFVHAPVEMKDCGTCHQWSAASKAVVLVKGIPELCVSCHEEKQQLIDSAATQHPVAGDCLTCHSPHGTSEKHLLRDSPSKLCESCHQDHDLNHPVGRHPVRFAMLTDKNEEISCASCHNPHGSQFKSLLRTSSNPTEICFDCHKK